jgi:hypothetical protein
MYSHSLLISVPTAELHPWSVFSITVNSFVRPNPVDHSHVLHTFTSSWPKNTRSGLVTASLDWIQTWNIKIMEFCSGYNMSVNSANIKSPVILFTFSMYVCSYVCMYVCIFLFIYWACSITLGNTTHYVHIVDYLLREEQWLWVSTAPLQLVSCFGITFQFCVVQLCFHYNLL